jgi:hypothetical protein
LFEYCPLDNKLFAGPLPWDHSILEQVFQFRSCFVPTGPPSQFAGVNITIGALSGRSLWYAYSASTDSSHIDWIATVATAVSSQNGGNGTFNSGAVSFPPDPHRSSQESISQSGLSRDGQSERCVQRKYGLEPYRLDRYGCHGRLLAKRRKRNPFRRLRCTHTTRKCDSVVSTSGHARSR